MRNVLTIALALAAFTLAGSLAAKNGSGLVVEMKARACVDGGFVTVSDIATLSGEDKLIDIAAKVNVGRSPSGEAGKEIAASFVSARLQTSGISQDALQFAGADAVLVFNKKYAQVQDEELPAPAFGGAPTAPVQGVASRPQAPATASTGNADTPANTSAVAVGINDTVSDLAARAINEIRQRIARDLKLTESDVGVTELSRNLAFQRLPKGTAKLLELVPADNGTALGRRAFKIMAEVGGIEFKDLVLTVEAVRFADVVVALKAIESRQAITAADVMIERRSFTTRAENFCTDISAVTGYAPRTVIAAGTVVLPNTLTPAVVIKRGDTVTVECVTASGLNVSFTAEAMEDGITGQAISVRRGAKGADGKIDRNAPVNQARVTGAGKARIDVVKNVAAK